MEKHENLETGITPKIEEKFNLIGLRDYEGSLEGKQVIPNGSPDPKESFGAGYDMEMLHRDLRIREPYGNEIFPVSVKEDFTKDGKRFLKVEDRDGNQADVRAERLALPEL